MAKQTFLMHLYADEDFDGNVEFKMHRWEHHDGTFGEYVGPVTVEAEVPDTFDMRAAKLKAKQEELTKVRAEFTKRITEIQRQINELTALEMS